MCVRSQHLTLSGASPNYYAFPFAIGNLLPDWTNYYEGMRITFFVLLEKKVSLFMLNSLQVFFSLSMSPVPGWL